MNEKPWAKMVEPIVKKCRLSVALDMNTTFNPDGSLALAELLEKMAQKLDEALIAQKEKGSLRSLLRF